MINHCLKEIKQRPGVKDEFAGGRGVILCVSPHTRMGDGKGNKERGNSLSMVLHIQGSKVKAGRGGFHNTG